MIMPFCRQSIQLWPHQLLKGLKQIAVVGANGRL